MLPHHDGNHGNHGQPVMTIPTPTLTLTVTPTTSNPLSQSSCHNSRNRTKLTPWIRKIPPGPNTSHFGKRKIIDSKVPLGWGNVSSPEGKMSPNWPFQKENCLEFHHQKKQKKTLR